MHIQQRTNIHDAAAGKAKSRPNSNNKQETRRLRVARLGWCMCCCCSLCLCCCCYCCGCWRWRRCHRLGPMTDVLRSLCLMNKHNQRERPPQHIKLTTTTIITTPTICIGIFICLLLFSVSDCRSAIERFSATGKLSPVRFYATSQWVNLRKPVDHIEFRFPNRVSANAS